MKHGSARLLLVLLTTPWFVSCGGDGSSEPPGGGGPGVLTARLVSPNGAEGAALFTIVGTGVEVSPLGGEIHSSQSADTTRVLIIRTQPGGIDFLISVPDTTRPLNVRVIEVADGENQVRGGIQDYSMTVTR